MPKKQQIELIVDIEGKHFELANVFGDDDKIPEAEFEALVLRLLKLAKQKIYN